MKCKIFDNSFAHAKNMTWHWQSKRGIEWYRGGDHYDTCFFTDNQIGMVDSVSCKKKVAIIMEPPAISSGPYDYIRNNYKKFNYVLTFSQELLAIDPNIFLYYSTSPSWIPEGDRRLHEKRGLVSIVASSKRQTEGHRLRHEVIERFSKTKGISVFGECSGKFTHPKTPFIAPYMYSIAIENSTYDDYFTEKITDCLCLGTIPIFWGTRNIGNHFDEDGIIRFETMEELEAILGFIGEDHYKSKMNSIRKNFEIANKYITPEDFMYDTYPFLFN